MEKEIKFIKRYGYTEYTIQINGEYGGTIALNPIIVKLLELFEEISKNNFKVEEEK